MKLEKIINIIVGITLLNNFYYLGFFVGVDYRQIIMLCGIVSFLFFIKSMLLVKNSIRQIFLNSAVTRFIFSIIILSSIFLLINRLPQKDIDSNDIFRLLFIFFYTSWTSLKYGNESNFKKYLITISLLSILIYIPIIYFEYNFPGVFGLIFKEENQYDETNWLRRIGATIRDPNAFSCIVICYSFFLYYYSLKYKKILLILFILLLTYIINLAGSRQGLLLYIVLLLYIFIDLKLSKLKKLLIFFSTVLLVLSFLITTTIQSERDSQSVLTRTLTSDTKAQGSSNDRINSIYEGIAYSYNNFKFFWGAGSFLFKSSWAKSHPDIADVPPHNAIIFLFIQFGIFVFFVYYAFYIFFKKILLLKLYIVGVLFLLIIFFLPSVLYTFTGIILLWFVDVLSYQPYQKKTIAHNMNNQKQFDA